MADTDTFTTDLSVELQREITTVAVLAPHAELQTAAAFEQAVRHLTRVQKLRRWIQKFFKEQRDPINAARAVNLRAERRWLREIRPMEARLTNLVATYTTGRETRSQEQAAQVLAEAHDTEALTDAAARTPTVEVRSSYSATINPGDFETLISAVAAGTIPSDALAPDWTWLNKQARSLGPLFTDTYGHAGLTLVTKDTVITR